MAEMPHLPIRIVGCVKNRPFFGSRFASLTGAGRPRLHAHHRNHMVEIVGDVKGAELAFNILRITSPSARRLHRPRRAGSIASPHFSLIFGRD